MEHLQRDNFRRYSFSFAEVEPGREEIRAFLKSEDAGLDLLMEGVVDGIMPLLVDNGDIAGGYVLKEVGEVSLETGSQVRNYMRGAEYFALFACTAGSRFTEVAGRFQREGSYLEAFVTDAIGSLTVERAMDRIQKYLGAEMGKGGMSISNRYSPGYCNWPVAGQVELFRQMGNVPLAISLTESCLMLPIKSVSGIIGVGKQMRKRPYACQICKNKSCTYRKLIQ
jgi:hypothetical protein